MVGGEHHDPGYLFFNIFICPNVLKPVSRNVEIDTDKSEAEYPTGLDSHIRIALYFSCGKSSRELLRYSSGATNI